MNEFKKHGVLILYLSFLVVALFLTSITIQTFVGNPYRFNAKVHNDSFEFSFENDGYVSSQTVNELMPAPPEGENKR